MERRAVLQMVGLSALALGGLSSCGSPPPAATGGTTPATGGTTPATGAAFRIPLADIPVGGGTIRTADKVVATQATAGQYRAFSAVCPHQGCLVDTIEGKDIVCPCHGSRFSIEDGSVVKGPTTKPLPPASTVSTEGSDLVVTV